MSDNLEFTYDIDLAKLKARVSEVETRLDGFSKKIQNQGDKMDKIWRNALQAVSGYFTLQFAKSIGQSILQIGAEFERLGAVLENSLGNRSLARRALADIKQFAASTPFQVKDLSDSFVKLVNQGFIPTIDQMTKLGDLASSVGKGFDQLTEAIIDAQTGEFERLKEFGIKARTEGDKITFMFKNQKTTVDNSADAIRNYILELGEMQGVAGAMNSIMRTTGGEISNINDTIDQILNNLAIRGKNVTSLILGATKDLLDALNSILKVPVSEVLEKERVEINSLVGSITSLTEGDKNRAALIDELNQKYPDFLGNMDKERISNKKIFDILKQTNEQYLLKIKIAVQEESITEINQKQFDVQKSIKQVVETIDQKYKQYVGDLKEGLSLQDKLNELSKTHYQIIVDGRAVDWNNATLAKSLQDDYNELLLKQTELQDQYNKELDTKIKLQEKGKKIGIDISGGGITTDGNEISRVKDNLKQIAGIQFSIYDDFLSKLDKLAEQKLVGFAERSKMAAQAKDYMIQEFGTIEQRYNQELARLNQFYVDNKLEIDEKYWAAVKDIIKKYNKESSEITANSINKISQVFSGISQVFSSVNSNIAKSAQEMSQVISGIANLAAGNYIGGATQVLSGLVSLVDKTEEKEKARLAINRAIESSLNAQQDYYNRLIQLVEKGLADPQETINILNNEIDKLFYKASHMGFNLVDENGNQITDVSQLDKLTVYKIIKKIDDDISHLQFAIDTTGGEFPKMKEDLDNLQKFKETLLTILGYQDDIDQLMQTSNQTLVGTTYDSVYNSLKDAFRDGKVDAQEFTNFFKQQMQTAILQSFFDKFLKDQIQGWYDEYVSSASGGYTESEINKLRSDLKTIVDTSNKGLQEMIDLLGYNPFETTDQNKSNNLSGAFQTITQESADVIAGATNAVRLLNIQQITNQLSIISINSKIEENTRPIKYLKDLYDAIVSNDNVTNRSLGR